MKTLPSGIAAAYASGATTICACLQVTRSDSVVEAFTSADRDVVVSGVTYRAADGLDISNLVEQSTSAVDNMEITVFPDETSYPQVDILAGRWDFAAFVLFEVDYTNPAGGINVIKRGTTGEADTLRSSNRFEFRGLKQALQQQLGDVTTKTCRHRLGDAGCKVDLTPFTFIYAITAVDGADPRRKFTAAAATQADDYFKEGSVTANDGSAAPYTAKVKDFAAGMFTLALGLPFAPAIGDHITAIAGCQKRHARTLEIPGGVSDCLDRFNNVLNFGGEPHMTGPDILTADPSP